MSCSRVEALRVAASAVEACTDTISIAHDAHAVKGSILFARRAIAEGEQVADEPMSSVVSQFVTLPEFSSLLEAQASVDEQQRLLRQSCPTGDGRVAIEATTHFNTYFSHSADPNCRQEAARFTASRVSIVATRPIAAGEEMTVDYDHTVGYEAHGHEPHIAAFLSLCKKHGVCKKPSELTLPEATVVVEDERPPKVEEDPASKRRRTSSEQRSSSLAADAAAAAAAAAATAEGDASMASFLFDAAVDSYTVAIDAVPSAATSVLLAKRSTCLLTLGREEDARRDAAQCVALRPTWPEAHCRLGDVHYYVGDYEAAETAYAAGQGLYDELASDGRRGDEPPKSTAGQPAETHRPNDAMWHRLQASSTKTRTALREAKLKALAEDNPDGVRWCQVGG